MNNISLKRALAVATEAASAAGKVIRANHRSAKRVNLETQHDIKLELDVQNQKLIERILLKAFPESAILGEEDASGAAGADFRWVIDPIDGTVNFSYGVPHVSVSIALQGRKVTARSSRPKRDTAKAVGPSQPGADDDYQTLAGVVYDPFVDEMWTAIRGQPARLNRKVIRVSQRKELKEAMVTIGFAKSKQALDQTLPYFNELVPRIRKVRIMGSAALSLSYLASGRFDAYIERGVSLWDIAAGGLIVECAGGEFWHRQNSDSTYRLMVTNGHLRRKLMALGNVF